MQTFEDHVDGFYDAGSQMMDDLRRRAAAHFRRQEQEKAALTSIEAFEAYRAKMRAYFLRAIGGLPDERTPLKARVAGTIECDNYTIEKTIYESLPEFPVTAALYLPKNLTTPAPAVVVVHGHADTGKSHPVYQQVAIDLVSNGFVVLAIDPIGQGERFQYFDDGTRIIGGCTTEHTHAGLQFFAQGKSIARHFIWDVMRDLDYLESRPEVDAARIGITGSSGGGTQTSHLMMCEPRLAAAMPCTFVMTLESYLKTGQPQDAEQILYGCMADGPDHDDFLTAMAPKPVLVGAVAYDFFPIEGAHEAVRRAKRIYALYDKSDNVVITVGNSTHEYSGHLREACVNWFKQHLKGEEPDFQTANPEPLPESALWATESGQVSAEYSGAKTVFDLSREQLPAPEVPTSRDELRRRLEEVLGVSQAGDRNAPIYPRIISNKVVEGYRTEKIFFFSAPDTVVTGVLVHPRNAQPDEAQPATLLLLENGTKDIPHERVRIESLLRNGRKVFVFDVRGIGAVEARAFNAYESMPIFNKEYKLGCDAMMLGLSTVGLRVFDVLRGYDYLQTRSDVASVEAHGVGSGAIFAYFAAALEEGFTALTCEDMPRSYREACETRYYNPQLYNLKTMPWGLLRRGDLRDFHPCLAPRSTHFIHPRNAYGEAVAEMID